MGGFFIIVSILVWGWGAQRSEVHPLPGEGRNLKCEH